MWRSHTLIMRDNEQAPIAPAGTARGLLLCTNGAFATKGLALVAATLWACTAQGTEGALGAAHSDVCFDNSMPAGIVTGAATAGNVARQSQIVASLPSKMAPKTRLESCIKGLT